MNVTEKLKEEHQLILRYIGLLNDYLLAIKKGNSKLVEHLPSFIQFVQEFADKYHHGKEEEILFKVMDEPEVLSHCNPIPQMQFEHDAGRDYIRNFKSALEKGDVNLAASNASGWGALLQEHIGKEDNILYPMGEEGLTDEQKKKILGLYQKVEEKFEGAKLEKKFVNLYQQLKGFLG